MLSDLLSIIFNPTTLLLVGIIVVPYLIENNKYKKTTYYQTLKLPYYSVKYNKGRYGEYLSYKHLKDFEKSGAKFLFNVYIPKNETETTEIDLIMICQYGLFVVESKNYSGWIFGNENQLKWTQTLPSGRGNSHKEHFYNPIKQNRSHINYLNAYIYDSFPVYSIIAFSDRCTLKSVNVTSPDIKVINRSRILSTVNAICNSTSPYLTQEKIDEIYNKLYPLTQVDDSIKQQHIANLQNGKHPTPPPINAPIVVNNPQEMQQENICPRCGATLVLRKTKKGENLGKEFWGCSNFPKCRYKKDL